MPVLARKLSTHLALALGAVAVVSAGSELTPLPTAPSDWQLARELDGVRTFERPHPGSPYAEVRAVAAVCATLPEVLAYVRDAAHFRDWIPDTVEARLLEVRSVDEHVYYVRSGLPWPLKDRDMVYRLQGSIDAEHADVVVVRMEGLPQLLPPQKDVVRMTAVSGQWHFRERRGRTDIVLEMHIDPGGAVPATVARRRILAMPGRMLASLANRFAPGCDG